MKTVKKLLPQQRSYIEEENKLLRVTHSYPFPKAVLWAALVDGDTWTKWSGLSKVTWTSPQPFSVGTTRTVEGNGNTIEEEFFIWDEGERMAFYVTATNLPVKAFAEDYKLVDTPQGCELQWAFRADANFFVKFMLNRAIKSAFVKGLATLETYIGQNLDKFGGTE